MNRITLSGFPWQICQDVKKHHTLTKSENNTKRHESMRLQNCTLAWCPFLTSSTHLQQYLCIRVVYNIGITDDVRVRSQPHNNCAFPAGRGERSFPVFSGFKIWKTLHLNSHPNSSNEPTKRLSNEIEWSSAAMFRFAQLKLRTWSAFKHTQRGP